MFLVSTWKARANFSYLHEVQICLEALPVFYEMDAEGYLPWSNVSVFRLKEIMPYKL
jgi:hypothetical protein